MLSAATRHLIPVTLRLLAACAMALALAAPAWAQMGRDQAAAAAQRQTGGRVLAVERVDSRSGPMWRVKVVTSRGEVRVVLIQAEDGPGVAGNGRRDRTPDADFGDEQDPQRGKWQRSHRPGRGG